ncbi:MAG: urease accessory protein UreD [Actinophytocola sp.]|uniref:urease accessory protein UreD n=1 Tax=Actinophytocola sp. TaxID=1872138 RepID=UPI0013236F7B|nr:urease accessory protein UreD [Actinophytocola sp.]MPZ81537.1 urease accessory protein UreD [Actinophytocola sp.]
MKASARLEVECRAGRNVVRVLRSASPLTLIPVRGAGGSAVVHLLNSAAAPLGGDELTLTVHVGRSASLVLTGVAATLALPGPHGAPSRAVVHLHVAEGASLHYRPEPTVVTARANHIASLTATLAADARLHTREVLVLGRTGERPGILTTSTTVTRAGRPVLRQHLTIGDPDLQASVAYLAGKRVLATELRLDGTRPDPASGEWWSRTPLAAGGTLSTALADDAVTALRHLDLSTAARSTG